ncbi:MULTISPECIES: FKBP-type peptidyl-prolyl cis-trans isomerase [Brevundimonas]|jgi:FKBP-type peptidyl-prolyl cis-trans isomerase FklB|uniref:FKBP-type peptidyl-prolyl cis-trans isomerase n=1 Tax=Brevundimonas TaxID=41275 RepID=UPI000F794868|nr:FKBP-type peptidyl-prolyl cis-trans isomerase [Brevundimonas diminuta]MDM8353337.1 FKBP-type peptidyl-prolyl cis-trans isomerase [Brevundimonas diminuta]RSB46584.1 FKBP-type peptidyl-prolyl cis-trans isomerase [Brevundimonas sp. 357]
MNFAWAKRPLGAAMAATALLALAACGRPAAAPEDLAKNAAESAAYMKKNASEEGVQTLPSGLQYKVVASGPAGGVSPDRNDLVRVDYEGTLTDGTVFDSSFKRGAPAVFSPEGVVPGWTEALQLMKPGDEWILFLPPELGYGEMGGPPMIPGNAVLVFRLKLLDVAPVPGGGRGVGSAMG